MRDRSLLALCLLLWALLSLGCAEPPPPAVQVIRPPVPAVLLSCRPHPEPPPDPVTDTDLAGYLLDLAEAGDDCRARLARVRGLVEVGP